MKNFGFIRTAAAVPSVRVADVTFNTEAICKLAEEAYNANVSVAVFPELSLTGYSCGDLFGQSTLIESAEAGIKKIVEFSRAKGMAIVAGAPVACRGRLYSCAVVIKNGNIKGIVPKTYVTAEENRWFASGSDFLHKGHCEEIRFAGQKCRISPDMLFTMGGCTFAIELGNDIWAPVPPSSFHALQGAQLILSLSADKEILMKDRYRNDLLKQHTAKSICGYVHVSSGFGESSQDSIFAGAASIWENGMMLAENDRYSISQSLIIGDIDIEKLDNLRRRSPYFRSIAPDGTDSAAYNGLYENMDMGECCNTDLSERLYRHIEPHPFAPSNEMDYRCQEILSMQANGLARRLSHINCQTAILGISGGLDSTLALIVAVMAFRSLGWSTDRIIGVTMPGFGTTSRTKNNATDLMEALGITSREISIKAACEQHFKDISHDPTVHDATYENSQARERTQILMDIANQTNGIVVGTGDLSELALGWATYNGDHMSMYGVNASIPKTLVRSLVKWAAENRFADIKSMSGRDVKDILLDIVDTPISPELLPANDKGEIQQVTEDLVGPYELHDFFLYNFIRFGFGPEKILFLAQKAFNGESATQYSEETIKKWLNTFMRRFFSQQFKRSCMPDGPGVGSIGLSPRGGWSMPSDAWSTLFKII